MNFGEKKVQDGGYKLAAVRNHDIFSCHVTSLLHAMRTSK